MEPKKMKNRIAEAPKKPGVYLWQTARGRNLYIGKANDLRARLSSYVKTTDARIRTMTQEARRLDWQETGTDIEALILESQLIKRFRPKYNIDLRDDKSYFLVAVTDEEFPQFIWTHQVRSNNIKKPVKEFIGPFTEGVALKTTLKVLRRLFPFCTCKQKHHVRCLNAHIGMCPGYCCLTEAPTAEQKKEYARHVRAIRDILTGKRNAVVTRLEKRMRAAAADGDLKLARDLQIKAERVSRVFENAQIIARRQHTAARHHGALEQLEREFNLSGSPVRIEGYDIAHIQGSYASGAMVVFENGSPNNQEYRLFNVRSADGGDTAALAEVLARRLTHEEWPVPDLIVVDGAKAQLNAVIKTLDAGGVIVPVIAFTKDERHHGSYVLFSGDSRVRTLKQLPPKARHLIEHVDREAHRFVIAHYRKRHRRQQLAP